MLALLLNARRLAARLMSQDEARRIAANIRQAAGATKAMIFHLAGFAAIQGLASESTLTAVHLDT